MIGEGFDVSFTMASATNPNPPNSADNSADRIFSFVDSVICMTCEYET